MTKGNYEEVNIGKIKINPKNPRGKEIVEDESFKNLTRSIKEYGILRPLLVIKENANTYRLIDGFRRFKAAEKARLEYVPCIVLKESQLGNFNDEDYMFQIHMNFEGWEPIEQALALEKAVQSIERELANVFIEPEKSQEKRAALVKKIKKKYNMRSGVAQDIVRFLSWPKKITEKAAREKTRWWSYIISIESAIIEPAIKHYPDFFKKIMSQDQVREALFNKVKELKSGDLDRAADIRAARTLFQKPKTGDEKKFVINLFRDFLRPGNRLSFEDLRDTYLEKFPEEKRVLSISTTKLFNAIGKFQDVINSFDENSIKINSIKRREKVEDIIEKLGLLASDIQDLTKKLTRITRR